jgi:hypothetical protein
MELSLKGPLVLITIRRWGIILRRTDPFARHQHSTHVATNTQRQQQCSLWIRAVIVAMQRAGNNFLLKQAAK